MYDVNNEKSFQNIRNWLYSIKEDDSDCLIAIIGNKIDLCPNEKHRVIKYLDGEILAKVKDQKFVFKLYILE
jgi:GTPase SAR1 family protein